MTTTLERTEGQSAKDWPSKDHRQVHLYAKDTSRMLTDAHRQLLLDSAITPDVIASSGIESTPTGIRFPWNDGGEDVWQFRPDNPELDDKGEPIKYLFPKGTKIPFNHLRVTGARDLLIIEGTKQSYAGLSYAPSHVDVIGMSGCWGWKRANLEVAEGKTVYVAIDADLTTNLNVWKAAGQLKAALEDEGAERVLFVRTGGDSKAGLDDVLAGIPEEQRAGALKRWLSKASPKRGPKPKPEADPRRIEAAANLTKVDGFNASDVAKLGADNALSDQFMAKRVVAEAMKDRMLFSPELGWMSWNGKVWEAVDESLAIALVGGYIEKFVLNEMVKPTIPVTPRERATLLSRTRIVAITSLCKGLTATNGDTFDAHPDLLTCSNGVIDLRTGDLLDFDSSRLLTTYVPTDFVPDATHEDVRTALSSMDPEVRDWTRVRFGQGITGHTPTDDIAPLLHGQGSNGKSVLMAGATATLGTGKTGAMRQLADAVLLGDKDAKEEKMALRGARIVFMEELPEGARLNVNHLKKVVGTPTITSRHLYRRETTWTASHSLFITTNYLPQVAETDHGTWRRLARIPFPYKFVRGEPAAPNERKGDPGLYSRVKQREQREALLAWMVSGAVDWYRAGKVMPEPPTDVMKATDAWRAESDMVLRFWSENLVADPDSHIPVNEMNDALNAFLVASDKAKWGSSVVATRFGGHDLVSRHGVEKRQTKRMEGRSRREGSALPNPLKTTAWFGVRFLRDDELDENQPVADPIEPSGVVDVDDVADVDDVDDVDDWATPQADAGTTQTAPESAEDDDEGILILPQSFDSPESYLNGFAADAGVVDAAGVSDATGVSDPFADGLDL